MTDIEALTITQATVAGFCVGYSFFHHDPLPRLLAIFWFMLTLAIIVAKIT